MKRRRILLVAVGGLVLLLGGLALAAALIPEDRVADAVAERAEAILGEPVGIDGVGLSLFPLPGVRLSGLSVGGTDTTALARVDRADVRVRLLPLFRGNIVISRLDIDRPVIAIEIDEAGLSNFPVLAEDTTEPSTTDIAFAVDGIRVTDGRILYRNRQAGTLVRLTGWNQRLSAAGAVTQGELTSLDLAGWVEFDDVAATLPGAVLPARDLALRVDHDAALDLTTDRLDLRTLEVDFDGVAVGGSGRVEGVNSGRPHLRLDLAADGLDAARLMAWVPDSVRSRMTLPDGRDVGLRGTATFRASVDGTVAPDTLPDVHGVLDLADGTVTVGPDALLEGITGQVDFSLDSVVARFDGRALGESFNAGLTVRDPTSPMAVVALSGHGDLDRLAALGLVSDTLGLTGAIGIDLRAQLPVNEPATSRAQGSIDLTGITLAGMDPVIRVPTAAARFDGGTVRVTPFRVELGPDRSALELDVTADGWIPAAVDSAAPPPRVTAVVAAGLLDLDALLGPSESGYPPLLFARLRDRTIDGRPPEEIAEELGLAVPSLPPADARIDIEILELVRNGLRYSDVWARARVTEDAVHLDSLRLGLMGGLVAASGQVEPIRVDSSGRPLETRVTGRFELGSVGGQPFFDILTPFRDHLAGRLDMAGTVDMVLDRHALPDRLSLEAGGAFGISEGRLANWAVLRGVTDQLGLADLDTLRFSDWFASFHIDGPRVTLDETALQAAWLDARTTGWFDFGGQMDVQATADLTREMAGRAGAIGQQILAAAPDGRIPVGLRIRGDVERPDVALDLAPARDAAAARARGAVNEAARAVEDRVRDAASAAEDTIRGAAGQAVDEAAERFELPDSLRGLPADSLREAIGDSLYDLLPDSVRVRADSLQQEIHDAIRDRLRRLLPGGGGGGDGGGG